MLKNAFFYDKASIYHWAFVCALYFNSVLNLYIFFQAIDHEFRKNNVVIKAFCSSMR